MTCPVCFYPNLPYPPRDYNICPCCGTEFGNDDALRSHEELRERWILAGANWFFGAEPEHWNPWIQLIRAGLGTYVQGQFPTVNFQADATIARAVGGGVLQVPYPDRNIPQLTFAG